MTGGDGRWWQGRWCWCLWWRWWWCTAAAFALRVAVGECMAKPVVLRQMRAMGCGDGGEAVTGKSAIFAQSAPPGPSLATCDAQARGRCIVWAWLSYEKERLRERLEGGWVERGTRRVERGTRSGFVCLLGREQENEGKRERGRVKNEGAECACDTQEIRSSAFHSPARSAI